MTCEFPRWEVTGQGVAADALRESDTPCRVVAQCLRVGGGYRARTIASDFSEAPIATPSPLKGERAGVRGEAVRSAYVSPTSKPGRLPSPEGRTENSPALQRWVLWPNIVRPEGTAEFGLSAPVLNAQIIFAFSPLTPALSPLRGEGVAADALRESDTPCRVVAQCLRVGGSYRARAIASDFSEAPIASPCPVTSHLGNSQVIGNQGRHPFVVQAGQKSSREVTGRNARTKSGGFSPLNGERAGVRGEAVRWAPGARLANTVHPPSPEGRTENSPAFQLKRWVTSPNIVRPEEGTAKFGLSAPVLNAQIG